MVASNCSSSPPGRLQVKKKHRSISRKATPWSESIRATSMSSSAASTNRSRAMSKRILLLLVLSLLALPVFAQKGEIDELGFKAEKVYDFTNIDSVNLFNGNLNISIPIGKRYKVGGALSYQLSLIFNGKIWDYETWTEYD